ncbi:MAG: hypothetical protein AAGA96_02230 [Verrucomicrobiota bacterium]
MKVMVLASLFALGVVAEARAQSLTDEPFLNSIAGKWSGSGQLTDQDGNVTAVQENWTGEFTDEGSFVMSGRRQFGEEPQEFSWEFMFNAATELVECEYWHTGMDEKMTFQVTLSDKEVELRTPFGEPGGELLVSNRLSSSGIDGLVQLLNPDGAAIIEGPFTHLKED